MFFGQYDHSIDDKSRLTLPARFRDALADGVVLSKGLDGSVDVYPQAAWQMTVAERIGKLDPLLPDTRTMQRHFFGGASEDVPDKQGRVLLPAPLLRYGKLTKDVTVVGSNDHLEIWDRAAWAERLDGIEGSADHVAERLAAQHV
jgi:MraZ protein